MSINRRKLIGAVGVASAGAAFGSIRGHGSETSTGVMGSEPVFNRLTEALERARHALTFANGLVAHDGKPEHAFPLDFTKELKFIDDTLRLAKVEPKSLDPLPTSLEIELQKMYDSEIHVDIGWLWDGGIDLSIGDQEATGHVKTVAEVLPWLQTAIATHSPESKYHVERMGGTFEPIWVDPPEYPK
jgi:hypothetical protein